MKNEPVIIYNLFPRLVGWLELWYEHFERIKSMGFNWVYINPIHYAGFSGSIYSIKEYYDIYDPALINEKRDMSPDDMIKEMINEVHKRDMKIMVDLVLNHTAIDCPLLKEHPKWYKYDEDGEIEHPKAMDGDIIVAEWGDLADIDNENSSDKKGLWNYWKKLIEHYLELGFDGFRTDAAYQVPSELWQYLIEAARDKKPDTEFFAETLGCEAEDIIRIGEAGFTYTFNSSKWWDYEEKWGLKQYNENIGVSKSISFAETHDTTRLAEEYDDNWAMIKQRLLFASIFSSGVMLPIGAEFGFLKKIDVVKTNSLDWEPIRYDLSDFISKCNQLKLKYKIFQEDNKLTPIKTKNPDDIFAFMKTSDNGKQKALIIINKDPLNSQNIHFPSLYKFFDTNKPIKDISIEYKLDSISEEFDYDLKPAQMIILFQE